MLKHRIKRIREEEEGIVNVDGVKLDAAETEVVFADAEKNIQVVVSPDPETENSVTVAVLTNSKDDVEEEKVLGSASVEGSEEAGATEARKAARREAFRKRMEARRMGIRNKEARRMGIRDKEAAREAFRKRLEARRASKGACESRKKDIAEARAKFRSKLGKRA